MKELDILLNRYLSEHFATAPEAERARFEQILELPDPQLAAYLVAGEPTADPGHQPLIDQLRGARR
jgi:succinate dehydrogenase flavin-adding protein (antitoxin of CptAB toxin-antitoxin module)